MYSIWFLVVTARRREPEGTCFEVSFAQWNGEEVGR